MEVEMSRLTLRYARLRIDDPVRQGRLIGSLQRHGQQMPVVVVPAGDGARYVLIDGYARVAALRSLARDLVDAVVLELTEAEALVLEHRLDRTRRRTALEEGWLIAELVDGHGLEQHDIAQRFGRSSSWVSRRLALVQVLPTAVQDAVRRGTVPPYAAMKFLVPLARANSEQCETLVAALGGQAITTRQMERLYVGWCRGDRECRARIAENPWLFLRASDALAGTPPVPPGDKAELLVRDLEVLSGLSQRARRRLRDGVLDQVTESSRRAVERVFEQTRLGFCALSEALTEEMQRARLGHSQRDSEAA